MCVRVQAWSDCLPYRMNIWLRQLRTSEKNILRFCLGSKVCEVSALEDADENGWSRKRLFSDCF